ncbi:hypothetical protein DXG03_002078 [Asterophora parasitica]|uniref:Uncharacterized protein n=1 Tax=Asterophora parasitica TaxID=117018 RepID=A0A9P7G2R0_9AGAR|nr:hypothetical protein DXG03_002078 [Asterophora parasitica]
MENLEGVSPRSDSVDSFDSEEHSEFEEDTIEFLNHELGLLMQYNPDLLVPDSNAIDLCPSLTPPPSFFDKHLDSQLSLKRIKVIPLATYVAEAVIHTSEYLKDNDITTPLHDSRDLFPTRGFRKAREASLRPPIDADALARIYQTTTSLYASVVSSTLLLHPNSPNWSTLLTWKCIEGPSNSTQYLPWTEAYALQIVQKKLESSDVLDTMDEGIREKLQRRLHQPPGLAFWQIFAISDKAQQLLRDLGSDTDSFRYQTCRTDGYSAPPVTVARPFDANLTSWGADVASMSSRTVSKGPAMGVDLHVPPPPRRSGRSRKSKDASTENRTALRGKAAPTKPSITVPTHREVEPSMAEKFLHRVSRA